MFLSCGCHAHADGTRHLRLRSFDHVHAHPHAKGERARMGICLVTEEDKLLKVPNRVRAAEILNEIDSERA